MARPWRAFFVARGRALKKLREVRARHSRSHRASRKKPTASEPTEAKIILFSAPNRRSAARRRSFYLRGEEIESSGIPRRFARGTRAHRARECGQFLRAARRFQGAAAVSSFLKCPPLAGFYRALKALFSAFCPALPHRKRHGIPVPSRSRQTGAYGALPSAPHRERAAGHKTFTEYRCRPQAFRSVRKERLPPRRPLRTCLRQLCAFPSCT